ncbi:hypothetical protein SAMN04490244_103321 [Tranquillimonas rosea]|uniref:Uncharacterized protein n=2 Tax=Tranquillimonas rosea TaxID=641238 RepID=A0A1H9SPN7_9RHOB|nr:hypothetical protein SAMN04490244_103321 [Tranquillimonas rosea]
MKDCPMSSRELTRAETERLALLSEKASAVSQCVGAILQHGYDSYSLSTPDTSNRRRLSQEIEELLGVIVVMDRDLDPNVADNPKDVIARVLKQSQHQPG